MKKSIIKKAVVTLTAIMCISTFGFIAKADYSDTISFGAHPAKGFANSAHKSSSNSEQYKAKLTSVNYIGMPSNHMPVDAQVHFRLYKTDESTQAAEVITITNAVWNSGAYIYGDLYDTVPHHSKYFVMASNSNQSIGATVSVSWRYTT